MISLTFFDNLFHRQGEAHSLPLLWQCLIVLVQEQVDTVMFIFIYELPVEASNEINKSIIVLFPGMFATAQVMYGQEIPLSKVVTKVKFTISCIFNHNVGSLVPLSDLFITGFVRAGKMRESQGNLEI